TENAASIARGQIVLADMQAGIQEHRKIGAVIHDESDDGFGTEARHRLGNRKKIAVPKTFVADLEDLSAAINERGGSGFEAQSARVDGDGIENRVDAGQFH